MLGTHPQEGLNDSETAADMSEPHIPSQQRPEESAGASATYQQLWAPWRLEYIQGAGADDAQQETFNLLPGADSRCFLCQAAGSQRDRARLVVHRTPYTLTVLNRYPYNNGHLLVCPQKHHARLDDLSDAEHLDVCRVLAKMIAALERTIHPGGFNVGLNLGHVAGAGLPGHLHWHVVPRWQGDTNFMPILAGVKVIPQALEALWEVLTDALRET